MPETFNADALIKAYAVLHKLKRKQPRYETVTVPLWVAVWILLDTPDA